MASNGAKLYKLYVGNIPWTVGHTELRQYFSKFGPVNLASVVFDKSTGVSRNFGFVFFGNKEGFEKAQSVQQHKLEGNNLTVQPANTNNSSEQKKKRTIYRNSSVFEVLKQKQQQ